MPYSLGYLSRYVGSLNGWRVSPTNPFIEEYIVYYSAGDYWIAHIRPNWWLVVPLIVVAIIVVSVILYRKWRKNCYAIHFAGKIYYGHKGETMRMALFSISPEGDQFLYRIISSNGYSCSGLYTDVELTKPLDASIKPEDDIYIYPKLK